MTEAVTPLDLIKLGIQTNDMTQVQKAYKLMTCEQVSIGEESAASVEDSYIAKSNPNFNRDKKGTTLAKKVPVKIRPGNMFVDDEDGRDKRPTPVDNRPIKKVVRPSLFIQVVCRHCGDEKTVNKQTLPISHEEGGQSKTRPYVCDECVARRR